MEQARGSNQAPRNTLAPTRLYCSGGASMEHGRGSNQAPRTGGAPMEHGGAPITLHALGGPNGARPWLHLAMESGWSQGIAWCLVGALPVRGASPRGLYRRTNARSTQIAHPLIAPFKHPLQNQRTVQAPTFCCRSFQAPSSFGLHQPSSDHALRHTIPRQTLHHSDSG